MKKEAYRKVTVILIITLFIGTSFLPIVGSSKAERSDNLELVIENVDQKTIEITAQLPEFFSSIEYINENKFALLELEDGGFVYIEGQAKLPKIRRMVEIPQGSNPIINIISEVWESTSLDALNLPSRILPVQPPVIKQESNEDDIVVDEDYYNTDDFFPSETAKILEINEIRGRRFALIEVSPLRYNPAQGDLELMISCELTIDLSNGIDLQKTIDNIERCSSSSFEEMFEAIFPNYGFYENLASSSKDPEGFLIIVYDDFNDEITPLANWKTTMGYDTTVTLTSNIPSGATADNIKAYIQDAYDTWTIPPAYILLVGDTPQIPAHTGTASGGETDSYFVRMDGDVFADIYIGRFPADNETQVNVMVDKTIYYEQGDFPSVEWIKKAAFIASDDMGQMAEDTHEYVMTTHLEPNGYTCDRIYEASGGSGSDISNALNEGRSLCIYSGHGSPSGWGCVPFYQSDVNALTNEGMYPFVCSHACSTSTYEGTSECFSETWLRAPSKGGIAMWGSSISTQWDPDDIIERRVFDAWWNLSLDRIGQMTDKGMYDSYQQYGSDMGRFIESYNVMGDASVKIWSDDPFTPEHDIKLQDLDIADVVAHGETQTVSATVRNVGNNTETGIVVDFKVNGSVLGTETIPSLDKMNSTVVSFNWDPAIGTYLVAIESRPIPAEYDLLNNNVNKTVEVIAAPAIDVSPSSFSFMVPTDATDTDTLTIENLATAEAILNYNISISGDLGGSWLSADPDNGTVAVDYSDIVTITVNTTGLSEGDYEGEIIITSNDLDDPEIIVTVDSTVVYGYDMAAISVNSPVGSVAYGTYTINATVQNKGYYPQTNVLINCSVYEGFLDYEEDFESGDGEYVASGGLWEYGTPTSGPSSAHSGSFCWGTNLDGNYGNYENARLESPGIMIPNGVTAELSFWHWYETENYYDGGNVKISTDGGTYWEILGEYQDPYPEDHAASSNEGIPHEPCFSSSSSGWQLVSFDLSDYANETVMFQWHFGSDSSSTDPGWFIDDVSVVGEYTLGKANNTLVFSTTELVTLNAFETRFIEFSPDWVAGGGNYTIQITTMLAGDEDAINNVTADVVFVTGPTLSFDPTSYNAGALMVNDTDSTSFDIWNSGVGTLTYTLSETCSWINLSSYGGDSTGEHDTITVDINTTGLTAGVSYHYDIGISSDGGPGVFGVDVYVVDDTTPIEDVNQSVFDRGFPIRHAVDGDWAGAQNFTPTMSAISSVDLRLRKFGTPEFDLIVELRENDPEGTLLDSVVFTPSEVDSAWGWLNVDFTDVTVTPGTDYFIVVPPAPSGVTTSFGYEWGYCFGDQYPDGSFWFTRDGGTLWRDLPTMYEFTFRTYGLI